MYLLEQIIKLVEHSWFIMAIYFFPVVTAHSRKLEKRNSLTVINLLFGWTVIAWAVCAVWSILGNARTEVSQYGEGF